MGSQEHQPKGPKRSLVVVSCAELRRGGGGAKKEWVLYNVVVTNADGIPIDREFRSWTKLEAKNSAQDFEVEEGEYKGTPQYTLHPIRTKNMGERVESLERQVLEMREIITRLQADATPPEGVPAPEATPAAAGADAPASEVW